MTQISISVLNELINRPEVKEIIDVAEKFREKYEENYLAQQKIISNFCGIVEFLLKNPQGSISPFVTKEEPPPTPIFPGSINGQPASNTASIPRLIYLFVNHDGFRIKDANAQWGGMETFRTFTPTDGIKSNYTSFLKAVFGYPNTYDSLYKELSENGQEVFSKIQEKYNSLYFNQITNKWSNYKISNLEADEKESLGFVTDSASLTFHPRDNDIYTFIGNDRAPKGTTHPKFNQIIFDRRRLDKDQFVYEKIFIINHYEDIRRGFENYKKFELPKVDTHIQFINEVNELISKFVILKKL